MGMVLALMELMSIQFVLIDLKDEASEYKSFAALGGEI